MSFHFFLRLRFQRPLLIKDETDTASTTPLILTDMSIRTSSRLIWAAHAIIFYLYCGTYVRVSNYEHIAIFCFHRFSHNEVADLYGMRGNSWWIILNRFVYSSKFICNLFVLNSFLWIIELFWILINHNFCSFPGKLRRIFRNIYYALSNIIHMQDMGEIICTPDIKFVAIRGDHLKHTYFKVFLSKVAIEIVVLSPKKTNSWTNKLRINFIIIQHGSKGKS